MAQEHTPDAALLSFPIADLLARWPSAVQVLLELRMACIGCDFSRFDTLAEALEIHGLQPAAFLEQFHHATRPAGVDDPGADQGGAG